MAGGSTLDPDNLPTGDGTRVGSGHGTGALGPSDTTDTGSDVSHGDALDPEILGSDTDAVGTGEEAGSPGRAGGGDLAQDLGFDRIVRRDEAGLGGGLDQAEEAQLGVRDDDTPLDADLETLQADDADADVDDEDIGDIAQDDDAGSDEDDDSAGARLAGTAHGDADGDDGQDDDDERPDDEDDEDEDEADENEGEPPKPDLEVSGACRDGPARVAASRA